MNEKKIILAIASGKGGTGKTLLSTNMFYSLMKRGERLCLVDCDSEEPNDMVFFSGDTIAEIDVIQRVPVIDTEKCTYCGKCHEYCAYNAIFILPPAKIIKVIEELCHGCGACSVACEFGAITEKDMSLGQVVEYQIEENAHIIETRMHVGVMTPVPLIKAGLRQIGDFPVVLLDSPPGTSCPFIQTAANADYVILITEPTPFGLSDLVQSVETLKTMDKKYGVIINRAGLGTREIYDYLRNEDIELLMEIPFDKEIAFHYSNGHLLTEYQPELQLKITQMFDYLRENYGNSDN